MTTDHQGDDDLDEVFKALADPTRRHLLDELLARPGSTQSELEEGLEMSRFGVAKHLRQLEQAGLVVAVRDGRHKRHHLNPVPIRRIHDRWLDKFTSERSAALLDLRDAVEHPTDPPPAQTAPTDQEES